MSMPQPVGDTPAYRGDPRTLRFVFENGDGSPRDLTGTDWVAEIGLERLEWDLGTTQLSAGIVTLHLTAEETANIAQPFVTWDLSEKNIWGYTLFTGRLVMEGQV